MVGINSGAHPRRVAAAATRFYAGEPMNSLAALTTGASSVNTVVVLTDTKPRVGTDNFQGIAGADAQVNAAGTVIAHKTLVVLPIPYITLIRGRAKTAANIDTDSELLGILFDAVDFDLTSSVYTIDDAAASNASGLSVMDGNVIKGTLDCVADARVMRKDIS